MKTMKVISALSLATILAACSTANEVASSVTDGVSNVATATTNAVKDGAQAVSNGVSNTVSNMKNAVIGTSKTVAYQCDNKKVVVANYKFDGEKATSVA